MRGHRISQLPNAIPSGYPRMTSSLDKDADYVWETLAQTWKFDEDAFAGDVRHNTIFSSRLEAQRRPAIQGVPEPLAPLDAHASSFEPLIPHKRLFIKTDYESSRVGHKDTKKASSSASVSGPGTHEAPGQAHQHECTACTDSFLHAVLSDHLATTAIVPAALRPSLRKLQKTHPTFRPSVARNQFLSPLLNHISLPLASCYSSKGQSNWQHQIALIAAKKLATLLSSPPL